MKQLVSIVPQEPFYDASRTIRENIMMGSTESVNVEALLDRVKLSELQELLDKKPATLSGGQKQRIAIARVFVKNTPIIILDEPTSALDKETERSIIDIVHEYSKNKTVIWITHNDMHPNIKRIYLESHSRNGNRVYYYGVGCSREANYVIYKARNTLIW